MGEANPACYTDWQFHSESVVTGMFNAKTSEIKQLESDLKTFAERSFPFATKNTVNQGAFRARQYWQQNIEADMVNRNKFTRNSIRVDQTRQLNIRRQEAIVGSIADYLADQEFGATKTASGSEGVAIPTAYSAGQGEGARPRTRLPRKPNKMQNIQLRKRGRKGASRKQKNLVAIKGAAASGRKYVFLDLGRTKGIFKVMGGRKRPRIKMVHDLSRPSVVIPRNPTLAPAVERAQKDMPEIYRRSLIFQAKRQGLFKG